MNDQALLELVRRADPVAVGVGEPPDALLERILASARAETKPRPRRGRWLSRWGVSSSRRWKPVMVTVVAVAVLAGAAVAIAARFGAFNGIGAAQRPQTPADRIDPKLLAEINAHNPARVGKLLPNSARLVKEVSGARIYVVATKNGQLCVLAQRKTGGAGMGCGSQLSQSQPTTAASFNSKPGDRAAPTISWGITVDGVTAVSFIAGGKKVTVPVVHNVWVYESHYTGVLESLTVHWADGSTETVP